MLEIKRIIFRDAYKLLLAFCFVFISCQEENNEAVSNIKIGQEQASINQIVLNPLSEKKVVLSGGDRKYRINVENSKIASAIITQDTLKIKSFELEGATFATIFSHDKKAYLDIKVVPNQLSFSTEKLQLRPKDINKSVTLHGGGRIVDLNIEDPNQIMDVKWNGVSRIIEIKAKYEGEATIIASSEGVVSKKLKVVIKASDEKGYLNNIGMYYTDVSIGQIINPVLIVKRKGMGTLLSATTKLDVYTSSFAIIRPIILPNKGDIIEIDVHKSTINQNGFSQGKHKVLVEEVRPLKKEVVLSGKGFKLVLPYE